MIHRVRQRAKVRECLRVAAQSFSASPVAVSTNHASNITLTGSGTNWINGTTVFSISGVAGVTKISQTVTRGTTGTLVITTGSTAGTLTISDGANSTTISVRRLRTIRWYPGLARRFR
jgi:hypothetical protein